MVIVSTEKIDPLIAEGSHCATADGAQLLGQYCTQCHELPGPGMHTAEEWPRVVARMNQRMQMMSGRHTMRMMPDIKALQW